MATPMEQFLLENAPHYQKLLKAVNLDKKTGRKGVGKPNPDVVICARVRPLLEQETAQGIPPGVFVRDGSSGIADVHELRQMVRGLPALKSSSYEVDHCFGPETPTEQIYDNVMKDLVPWAWDGGVATLFAYGQTGSGKTYTTSHIEKLVAAQLMAGQLPGERKVYVTIVELSGNSAYDLLNSRKTVSILEDSFGVTQIAGAADHEVKTAEELLTYIDSAAAYRRTEATIKNDTSSRSHAICRIRLENPSAPADEDGLLFMVDLAGSEAARDRVNHDPERMRESRNINTSLSVLKDCIRGRAEVDMAAMTGSKTKPYVPFRQSSLTKVLKHVFDPSGTRSCRTVVIACVNPSLLDLAASRNTLRYAEMLRVLMPKTVATQYDPLSPMTWSNEQLRDWIKDNSGSPPIDGKILAPRETGAQLLRLPPAEFEARCLNTNSVRPEQAKAFRAKLWQFHVDSKSAGSGPKPTMKEAGAGLEEFLGHFSFQDKSTSRHPDAEIARLPFKERIRPGMVVSWTQHFGEGNRRYDNSFNMAIVLCPASAAGPHAVDLTDKNVQAQAEAEDAGEESRKWLCAYINPGMLHESYEVQIWRQVVMSVDQMDAEVLLEYDPGNRYYFITL